MSLFNYALPSGAEFTVRGPAGATQAQADKIFYEQVAAGALVGYESGQTLTSAATQITKFELSRLDRGTAGVDNPVVLAVIQGLPVITGIPNLNNVPLTSPINEADIVDIKGDDLGPNTVGTLNSYQVQKLLAQIANLVDQDFDQITQDKGIGQYGFTAYSLEQVGLVKPGTSLRFFKDNPEDFVSVMSSPSVWTGKDGIYSLNDLLGDPELQTRTQVQLMQLGYNDLLANGTIVTTPQSSIKLSSGQVYTGAGLQSSLALTALSLLGTNFSSLSGATRNAFASSTSLSQLLSTSNINLSTIGSGAVNSLTAGLNNLSNVNLSDLATGLTNQISSGVGALVSNASKFGSEATALWAKAGNLSFDGVGSSLSFGNITSNLTNLVPGSLANLSSSLDIFGKAGSFATNFANPLAGLNNLGNFSSLTGGLSNIFGGGGGDLVSGTQVAAGFNNTVNRSTVDAAFARIVGNDKVPLPNFQYPSAASLATRLDIQQAQNFLQNQLGSVGVTQTSNIPVFTQNQLNRVL